MNDIYSFYQLISKYQIEIPIIQRDYAQGRNNSKAADVRKSLVDNMIKAVKEDKPLFFDFVYGRVDNNKFIPFDGQQRLTTLFLFHKYVFEKCQSDSGCNHKDNCSCGGILGRFSYATRQSSREFCEKLVQEKIISGNSLTDNIKNQSWFYPDWEKDPTVMGMLTMLDEIHCQMRNETDFKTFAEKLTSGCNCPITFHFVDMGEHKMSDETYVKMNARGKTLTPFENFKASLEQYLEDKKLQDLQNRLKNKIDGDWLDLFWNINGNVLPDTLMMSFFNRHFMNIWRSWYANNSKSEKKEEYDSFNTRIQKEMPLYPTKDDFVSFEIYSYVMDNCGVDNCGVEDCLYPIFNIWDALCKKDNSILNDCQAVWNRKDEGHKWNLYQGDKNNNNRETYPSRVAFYALMKYFTNNTDTASLTQWMRVVWNIIENSTIDSSDTYHAALRLIEKLSAKSHTIYNALANEFESFELGNQYHAQEQAAEEIAKAKQILDENGTLRKYVGSCKKTDGSNYITWEEIIIEAEKYAFFKGSIRFLFTNENGEVNDESWDNFDKKWENAKKYYDENGVKEKYKTNSVLLRTFISRFKKWGEFWGFNYDNEVLTWKYLLTSERYLSICEILSNLVQTENMFNSFSASLENCEEGYQQLQENVQNDLVKTNIIAVFSSERNAKLNWRHNKYCLYPTNTKSQKNICVISDKRNTILAEWVNNKTIECHQRVDNSSFFWGWDINFIYEKLPFRWHRNDLIYLMDYDNHDIYLKRDETKTEELDKYFCFDTSKVSAPEKFKELISNLISEWKNR